MAPQASLLLTQAHNSFILMVKMVLVAPSSASGVPAPSMNSIQPSHTRSLKRWLIASRCNSLNVSLSILNFAELVEDLNFERRRMAREQRLRKEEARK